MSITSTNHINTSASTPAPNDSVEIPTDFKSTLPPRKRAKTKEEKEQRRIERILRNRKAAHQSREKKRLHLKFLEQKCSIMERILAHITDDQLYQLIGNDKAGVSLMEEYHSILNTDDETEFVNNFNSNVTPSATTFNTSSSSPSPSEKSNTTDAGNLDIVNVKNEELETDFKFQVIPSVTDTVPRQANTRLSGVPQSQSQSDSNSDSPCSVMSPVSNITMDDELFFEKTSYYKSANNISTSVSFNSSPLQKQDSNGSWDLLMNRNDSLLKDALEPAYEYQYDTTDHLRVIDMDELTKTKMPMFSTNNNNNNDGSYDLDNWRNPAVITNL
ncbi:hypothetical protein NCAS_0C03780 [Naumovozyma castellii]|uniref:BZIP domain-containing protein n=1 Tax=Naumovozyma castellii TaxID=27288 RepID=G0VD07_NAUCA|nr:hypothetical protein NCAS_0C03780 [Naumovozyma castellii CBS 4309]CCC69368.1 hypothetical protein NCAS_0C03780 [Naumovozyma castellii CBS 4309]